MAPFRQVVRDDAEEFWRQQIQSLIGQTPFDTLEFFQLLGRILRVNKKTNNIKQQSLLFDNLISIDRTKFQDVSTKSIGLTREACELLNCGGGVNSASSSQLSSHLSSHAELLSTKAEPPIVWFSTTLFDNQILNETLRNGMLEIQSHLETFLDKKDHATEVNHKIKFPGSYCFYDTCTTSAVFHAYEAGIELDFYSLGK